MDFFIIANAWSAGKDNPTSKHRIALELIRQGHRVLWIEGSGMRTPSVGSSSDRLRMVRKVLASLRGARSEATDLDKNPAPVWGGCPHPPSSGQVRAADEDIRPTTRECKLHVLSPLFVPLPRYELVRRFNGLICRLSMRFWGWRLGFRDPVLINYVPVLAEAMRGGRRPPNNQEPVTNNRRLAPRVVYHCVDRWDAFSMYDSAMMGEMDQRCCRYADLVIASAGELYHRCRAINPNTVLISHGVDWDHFRQGILKGPPAVFDKSQTPVWGGCPHPPRSFQADEDIRPTPATGRGLGGEALKSPSALWGGCPHPPGFSEADEDIRPTPPPTAGRGLGVESLKSPSALWGGCPHPPGFSEADEDIRPTPPPTAGRGLGVESLKSPSALWGGCPHPPGFPEADEDIRPTPVIGFFGLLSEWVDQELILRLAREFSGVGSSPRASIVLIGKADVDVSRLEGVPNIHLLGPKPFAELPAYIADFTVGLIPFVVNELTKSVNPIKLREMLSAGCPVVSTALPEVRGYQGAGVMVADTVDQFVEAVAEHIRHPFTPEERAAISAGVANETWSAKVGEILAILAAKP